MQVTAPESGKSASLSSSGVTCLLEGHWCDRGEHVQDVCPCLRSGREGEVGESLQGKQTGGVGGEGGEGKDEHVPELSSPLVPHT